MLPSLMPGFVCLIYFALVSSFSLQIPINNDPDSLQIDRTEWKWADINPRKDLIWHDCYESFKCARLDVPTDWTEPSEDDRVVLAIIKLPATDLDDYKGPVFTNPGGPGGSGVWSLRRSGKAFQKIVGTNHDIISFDPRGIGATTPPVYCWTSKEIEQIWSLQEVGNVDSHPGVLYDAYARASASSGLCTSFVGGNETSGSYGLLSHVSTTSVARDMLEILHKTGNEKLRYWGFSYGTMLGGMFAAMYPDKIERIVNDGNVDYGEWTTCAHKSFLHDADTVMSAFYTLCHSAGSTKCALWASTPSEIQSRLETVLANLKTHPIVVATSPSLERTIDLPDLITYSGFKKLISTSLYRPIELFPEVARISAALEIGDGAPFLEVANAWGMKREQFSCGTGMPDPKGPDEAEGYNDAFRAIMCSDGGPMDDTVEEFEKYADGLMEMSEAAGAVNVLFRIACVGWKAKAKWRYSGPFEANTSYPVLFIANKADNVTPLRSAISNAKGFNGSVILIQKSYGHTSLAAPSICTAIHIRNYFQYGTLPDSGTECDADMAPFQEAGVTEHMSEEDRGLYDAMRDLRDSAQWIPFAGGNF